MPIIVSTTTGQSNVFEWEKVLRTNTRLRIQAHNGPADAVYANINAYLQRRKVFGRRILEIW